MARILLVHPGPDFSVADVYRGWIKALKAQGHDVKAYNTNERLTFYGHACFIQPDIEPCEHGLVPVRQALPDPEMIASMATKGLFEECFVFEPEVIFFISGFYHTASTLHLLRSRGIKIVMLHTESPYQDEEQAKRGAFANLNLVNDPLNFEKWKELGPVAYIPHSFDDTVHYPAKPRNYEIDFAFVGTIFNSRAKFFSEINFDGIDTVLGGNGWEHVDERYWGLYKYLGHQPGECVDNTETARIYRMTKMGINVYRQEGETAQHYGGWAMGPREVEMAACGLFFIRDPRGESDEVFPFLPSFSSPAEAEELIRYYVSHDDEREKLADKALVAVQDRTFDNQAQVVCEIMDELGIT
jgi:spore maturation protein CgeB